MANNSVILLRVEPRLKREIERCAEANERSVSQEVRLVLKREYKTPKESS